MPWPLQNRSTYTKVVSGMPVGDKPAFLMCMKSIKERKWMNKINIEKNIQNTEVFVNFCSIYVLNIGKNTQKLVSVFNIDP